MLSVISQFLCHLSYYEYIRKDYITTLISIIFLISAFASYCYIVLLCGAHYNIWRELIANLALQNEKSRFSEVAGEINSNTILFAKSRVNKQIQFTKTYHNRGDNMKYP